MSQHPSTDWIPFDEGRYLAKQVCLVSTTGRAVAVDHPTIHITTGRAGRKQLQGICRVTNMLVVDLLEDAGELDLLIDLGGEFTYLLEMPDIQSGKVFSPDVKSTLRFSPVGPWKQLSRADFNDRLKQLTMIDDQSASG